MAKPNPPVSQIITEVISDEREIAEVQLRRLRDISRERILGYEEAKLYDIYTKCLLLTKSDPTAIVGNATRVEEIELSTQELLKIVDVITEEHVATVLNIAHDEPDTKKPTE